MSAVLRGEAVESPTSRRNVRLRGLRVSEDQIAEAVRIYYTDTHNLAEGAGAAPLAALIKEKGNLVGKRAAVILGGGNIDMPIFRQILGGRTPVV